MTRFLNFQTPEENTSGAKSLALHGRSRGMLEGHPFRSRPPLFPTAPLLAGALIREVEAKGVEPLS